MAGGRTFLKSETEMDRSSSFWWNVAAGVSVVCAVLVTSLVVRRELFNKEVPLAQALLPQRVANWDELVESGQRIGASNPILTIVEFADFECPFCKRFALEVFHPFLEENSSDVALVYRHFPLPYHQHAIPAARAADCAAEQSRFHEYHNDLYRLQDSLGTLDYVALAREANLPDLTRFEQCVEDDAPLPSVAEDTVAANIVGVRGTPAIIVDGTYFPNPPSRAQLDSALAHARSRRK